MKYNSVRIGRRPIPYLVLIALTIISVQVHAATVDVGNVEELYAAMNDPANAGATLQLSPGVYMLSALNPGGTARPNGGRLELLENMSLLGVLDDRSAVVIDAANLPTPSFQVPGLTGAIRMGRGTNSVEWLTVRNAVNGSANIETDLIFPGTAYIRVAHVASTNSVRGIDVRNLGAATAGATIVAEIIENDLFGNLVRQAEGLRIGNNLGANGAAIFATLSGNRCFNNFQGVLIENNRTNNAYLSISSSGDRFSENGAGAIILAGLSFGPTPANGNTVDFSARGSRFDDNNGPTIFDVGGLIIVGGENTMFPNGTSNNTVNARLRGCRMTNNQGTDLTGIGARSNPLSAGTPGINNHVTIEMRGTGKSQPITFFEDTIPFEANTTNSVTILQ